MDRQVTTGLTIRLDVVNEETVNMLKHFLIHNYQFVINGWNHTFDNNVGRLWHDGQHDEGFAAKVQARP